MSTLAAPPTADATDTSKPRQPAHFRKDIQGLRALAVGVVVLFHLWPNRLSGGFVGVDVFFVISGFLITSHILREVIKTGKIQLTQFWARRIRRLLPDAFLVLGVTALVTFFVVPINYWSDFFNQIFASGAYFQNWRLAADAVDYMAIGAAPTPAQHYWSLSIEEQFYIVWPILVALAMLVLRLSRIGKAKAKLAVTVVLVGVVAVSLTYSIIATASNQSWAYFATTTRAWEFAAGGLAACIIPSQRIPRWMAALAGWLGIAAICWSAYAYSGATLFPGYTALVPVLGTVMILWFGATTARWSIGRILSLRFPVWIGRISYAIYLWHWPLIIFLPFFTGRGLTTIDKAIVGVATLALAALSTRFVEDPVRRGRLLATRVRAFSFAAIGILLLGGAAFAADRHLTAEEARVDAQLQSQPTTGCFGPAALSPDGDCASIMGDGPYLVPPELVSVQNKKPRYRGCQQDMDPTDVASCTLGADPEVASKKIILVGDSHVTHWFTGFDVVGEAENWTTQTMTKASCPLSRAERYLHTEQNRDWAISCNEWNDNVLQEIIDSDADTVVVSSNQSFYKWQGRPDTPEISDAVDGFAQAYKAVADSGKKVVVIKAAPRTFGEYVPDCLVANGRDATLCGETREEAIRPDAMVQAVERLNRPDVQAVDLDDRFCDSDRCYPVVGDVVVYRDYSHLSAEYSTLLMPWIAPQL